MRVLLTGASGFIGRHLLRGLLDAGHQVVCAVRNPAAQATSDERNFRYVQADFVRDTEPADWLPHVREVDAVINAVGIIRERGAQSFDLIHRRAPCALFAACAQAGVSRVVQISALGADDQAVSRYHLSKKAADDFLASLPISAVIVQPSLVYGDDGDSAKMFTTLASLPLIPLPGKGGQIIQPVHVDDVVAAILALLTSAAPEQAVRGDAKNSAPDNATERAPRPSSPSSPSSPHPPPHAMSPTHQIPRIALVGPQATTLREFLATLRRGMNIGRAWFVGSPIQLVRATAAVAGKFPASLLDTETLQMLERGNSGSAADVARMEQLLGRAPRAVAQFIAPQAAPAVRVQAQLNWLLPKVRVSLALVWIWTGIVSLGLYPVAKSYALLASAGVPDALAPLMLYGAALLDIAIGVGILVMKQRRWLWLLQFALILVYTLIITVALPEFWLHPYGPVLKNLPMLAAIWLVLTLENQSGKGKLSRS